MVNRFFRVFSLVILSFLSFAFLSAEIAFAKPESEKVWSSTAKKPEVQLGLPSFAPVIEGLGKSVVNISIKGTQDLTVREKELFPFLENLPESKRQFQSLGSGFIIHEDGFIVTNNHVVEQADKISIKLKDETKEYEAKVIGRDPKTDIALLKVEIEKPLTPVVIGDSDSVKAGDWVIAIGNPFQFGHTATVGIVSALGRKVRGAGPYGDFIQTDASINPGNSGGPLFNAQGEVVGVNTAIISPGASGGRGFNIGIGFATPINLVKDVITQLNENGRVSRGWLGVLIQRVDDDMAALLGMKEAKGALVADVIDESPAAKGGVQRRDVIVSFDGKRVNENDELPLIVAQTKIGREVNVEVFRKGANKTLRVKIDELKDTEVSEPEPKKEENKIGATVQTLTNDLAKSLGVKPTQGGVVVSSVEPDGIAQKSGLIRGDIVLEVGDKVVKSVKDFNLAVKNIDGTKPILLLIQRGGNTLFLTLKPEEK